ncbi:MAG: DUF5916 domain-containing protein [Vicinamibacterales bacterium]
MPASADPACRCLAAALAMLCWAVPAAAQPSRERPFIGAVRVEAGPRIDGALDDAAWTAATPVDTFTQQEPNLGQPATERTEVRIVYDARTIYIAVHAYQAGGVSRGDDVPAVAGGAHADHAGGQVVATEMRRDSDRLFDEDNFQVILDTFKDSRNGYMFVTTPLGAKLEQQIFDEGEGGGRGGATANVNRNWDGVWDAAARITDDGWTAELAIPTNTLRFRPTDEQTWGINFLRHIRRKNELDYWSPIPRAYSLTRVSLAGELRGMQQLSLGWDLKLKPFVVAGPRRRELSASNRSTTWARDVGLDARYGVSAGLNLDVTLNTDFAQVEVDDQQVNLTRFGLFFPEKRDFFLEASNFFTMGTGASFTSTPVQTDLFFSRRIGLSDSGQPVPILGGARLTGKVGRNNIAVLDVQTDEAFGRPGDNFFVSRYSRDVLRRSRVGAIFINKESVDGSPHYNRTMGVDGNFSLGNSFQVNSYVAKTFTNPDQPWLGGRPIGEGRDMAFYGRVAYRDPRWQLWLNYLDVQENFNPEAGFLQRSGGHRTTKAYLSPTPRPKRGAIKVMEPMYVLTYTTDQGGRLVGRLHHLMWGTTLRDDSFINVIYQRNLDVLDQPFNIRPDVRIPVGSYNMHEWMFTYNTSPGKRFFQRVTFQPNEFYGGTRRTLSYGVGARASSQLSAELNYSRNDVKMPWGDFLVNLTSLRVDYTFSPRMTIRSLTQYNTATHEISNNIRFNLIHRPGSDLFVVYNDLRQTGLPADVFAQKDRQLVVKLNYLIQK